MPTRSRRMSKMSLSLSALLLTLGLAGTLLWWKVKRTKTSNTSDLLDVVFNSPYSSLANYILAQARVESANFTSALFIDNKNAFGMKDVKTRPFVGSNSPADGPYMSYDSLTQSVEDFLLWMDYTNFPKSVPDVEAYVYELYIRNYFEAPLKDYLIAMRSWL